MVDHRAQDELEPHDQHCRPIAGMEKGDIEDHRDLDEPEPHDQQSRPNHIVGMVRGNLVDHCA